MWLILVLLSFFISISAQFLLLRSRKMSNPLKVFFLTGTLTGICLIAYTLSIFEFYITVSATFLYAFLCELYIFLFSFAYSSVSANLLVRLQGRSLEREVIDDLYDSDVMVTRRVEGLVRVGLLDHKKGIIIPTENGRMVAGIFNAFRRFFGHN